MFPLPKLAAWTCRAYSTACSMDVQGVSPSTASSIGRARCLPFQSQQYECAGHFLFNRQQYGRAGCTPSHHQQCERARYIPVLSLQCGFAGCMYLFFSMPECQTDRHPVSLVPKRTKMPMPEPVRYRNKGTGTGAFRYRTVRPDDVMPMPSYGFELIQAR